MSNLLIYSIKSLIKRYCYSGQRARDAYISWGACGNSVKSSTVQCWNRYIRQSDSAVSFPNKNLRVPMICCLNHQAYQCNQDAYEDVGSSQCNHQQIGGLQDIFNTATFNMLKYMCGIYIDNDNDKCKPVLEQLTIHHNNLPRKSMDQLPKSPLSSLVKILDSIPPIAQAKVRELKN